MHSVPSILPLLMLRLGVIFAGNGQIGKTADSLQPTATGLRVCRWQCSSQPCRWHIVSSARTKNERHRLTPVWEVIYEKGQRWTRDDVQTQETGGKKYGKVMGATLAGSRRTS